MASIQNLTEKNVIDLRTSLETMHVGNPELNWTFQEQESGMTHTEVTNEEIFEKLESLERKIDLIFGSAVLINGRFVNVKS